MRNRSTRIRFPVYSGYEVRVIFSRDFIASARRLGEKDDLSGAGAASVRLDEHPMTGWILFGLNPTPDIIAHEAAHAIYGLAAASGATFDEETFAYHLGHLVGRIHKFLGRA